MCVHTHIFYICVCVCTHTHNDYISRSWSGSLDFPVLLHLDLDLTGFNLAWLANLRACFWLISQTKVKPLEDEACSLLRLLCNPWVPQL